MWGGGLIRRGILILSAAGAVWTILLGVTGGFDATVLGVEISAHDPFRPLLFASVALTIYILAGGEVTPGLNWAARRRVPSHATLARALAVAITLVAWVYGTKAVGGADSYGYLSHAELWAEGSLKIHQPFMAEVPWPTAKWSFSPVGSYRPMDIYRPVEGDDRYSIVPLYPPGLPMLLAAAGKIGGHQAKFMVIPLLVGVLVIATYGIGVRLASPTAGLIGAWLLATSPAVLFMMMATMSDAPVAGVWAAAFYLLLGRGWPSAAGAGVIASIAVLIRPNLNLLIPVMGLIYVFRLTERDRWRLAIRDGAVFALACVPGIAALALINNHLYGSPFMSGYGPLDPFFSLDHVGPNATRYLGWLAETQTPLALVGLAVALVPSRRLWNSVDSRSTMLVVALFVLVVWGVYFIYLVFDAWWYLRFLLPSFPFIMLGVGTVLAALVRWRPAAMAPLVTLAVLLLGVLQINVAADRSTFDLWEGERRYVTGARMANQMTERNSLIIAHQHTGSVRYYGSRMTANFDFIPKDWVDRSISWLQERGVHPYLLVEDFEMEDVRARYAGQKAALILDRPPIAVYRNPGTLYLFDLTAPQAPDARPEVWTGTYRSVWAAPQAPTPRFVLDP
jgi:hypothetical protein